jgi:carboxypeptidase C (cathepsin A)
MNFISVLSFVTLISSVLSYTSSAINDQIINMPGLNYDLNFNQFSGYLQLKSNPSKNIHYWLVESENNPETAPLVFWTNGGPGCSGLIGFMTEQGPFRPDENGNIQPNKWAWNKNANMVFLEQPVGVGFSYSENSADYKIDDEQASIDNLETILSFLDRFPEYAKVPLYLTSESYGGHYIPTWADKIVQYNKQNNNQLNFRGFAVGNPYVDYYSGVGAQMQTYWDHQLLPQNSWSKYESAGCTDPIGFLNNSVCSTYSLDFMKKIGNLNPYALDYPICTSTQQMQMLNYMYTAYAGLQLEQSSNRLTNNLSNDMPYEPCEDAWSANYLNNKDVKKAIHVKDIEWEECSRTTKYSLADKMKSTIHIYRKLIDDKEANLNILIYSGDDDAVCGTKYTNQWVYGLDYLVTSNWKVWSVNGQVAGYETQFKGPNNFRLATVHGAGHEVPTYKPEQAYVLFESFINHVSLN